jgi:type I restriction enzyme M protein
MAKRTPKKPKDEAPQNGTAQLMKELWQAAVNLRGSIEPADYKRYVLPIIFLRFLSLRYERRREELEALLADPKSDYFTKDAKARARILADADEYRAAGAFIVPEKSRWSYILQHAQADTIKSILDDALELLEKTYPDKLRGLLPRIYAGSNLDREGVTGLINLFSKDIFKQGMRGPDGLGGGEDLVGRVYEYFIGEFANSEGKRGGEYFTPVSIVRTLVAMLEPEGGVVYDPCCGAGGMFVQSDVFTKHSGRLSFIGQESKDFTYRLCRMNLFIHGIDGNIQLGSSYFNDLHADTKADYVIANPPFNDGAKGEDGWGAHRITSKDPRLDFAKRAGANGTIQSAQTAGQPMPLSPRNANTMWMMHFLHHLRDPDGKKHAGGTAGFVMATGELSNSELHRLEVRKALVEHGYVDCIVQLTGQLFANTQIPCCLWFLSKNRGGGGGFRARKNEILFIDGRKLGVLIPGSRKQKQLSAEEVEKIASVYREFKRKSTPAEVAGFCKAAMIDEIREHNYALTPGRYVGAAESDDPDEPFEDRFPHLAATLDEQFKQSAALEKQIRASLAEVAAAMGATAK